MDKKEELKLEWSEQAGALSNPHITVGYANEGQTENGQWPSFAAAITICPKPRCGCVEILLRWQTKPATAQNAAMAPQEFWFDLDKAVPLITPELHSDATAMRLAEIIRTELSKEDRQQLRSWFHFEKLRIIQTTPIRDFDIRNLPDTAGGKMVSFTEVFPRAQTLFFTRHGETWVVDEQYCVETDCACTEMALGFLKIIEASGQQNTKITDVPSLYYNYDSGTCRPLAGGWGQSRELLTVLKETHASLNLDLNIRALTLRNLYMRRYFERTDEFLRVLKNSPRTAPPGLAMSRKIGRNELCPCGSGRKYKHCCLDKPSI